jgi:peptide/nickel transport system substrate-binding protein
LFFNNKKDLLNNKDIRQALSYATDKKEIINKALFNEAQQVDGPILPNFFGYNQKAFKYNFDLTKAKSILEKNGFKADKDGIRKNGKKKLEFNLVVTDSAPNKKTAELIQSQWEKAGINIKIETINTNILQRDYIRPRNYDILLFGESLGADSDVFPFWHSSEVDDPGLNLSCYINKEVDRCLEEGRVTGNLNLRKQRYIDFQNMIIEDAPAVFLYSPNYIYGASSKIKGINLGYIITPADRFDNANQWFINYKREGK